MKARFCGTQGYLGRHFPIGFQLIILKNIKKASTPKGLNVKRSNSLREIIAPGGTSMPLS